MFFLHFSKAYQPRRDGIETEALEFVCMAYSLPLSVPFIHRKIQWLLATFKMSYTVECFPAKLRGKEQQKIFIKMNKQTFDNADKW